MHAYILSEACSYNIQVLSRIRIQSLSSTLFFSLVADSKWQFGCYKVTIAKLSGSRKIEAWDKGQLAKLKLGQIFNWIFFSSSTSLLLWYCPYAIIDFDLMIYQHVISDCSSMTRFPPPYMTSGGTFDQMLKNLSSFWNWWDKTLP